MKLSINELFFLALGSRNYFYLYQKPKFAYLYTAEEKINLLTGKREASELEDLQNHLEKIQLQEKHSGRVIQFFYEYGALLKGIEVSCEAPLVIDLQFDKRSKIKGEELFIDSIPHLSFASALSEKHYQKLFKEVQNELKAGNCYQVNLTHTFSYYYKANNRLEFLRAWNNPQKRSAFAHALNIPLLQEFILSNSPECLWKIKEDKIYSYPIKGTEKILNADVAKAKNILSESKKDLGELNMITDLMRNDLTALSGDVAKVIHPRKYLEVPELIHTFSVIRATLPKNMNLFRLMDVLFPGGSITGAPKKRVMEIIHRLEEGERGIYCGSTVILDGKVKTASINIRTAHIKEAQHKLYYGSGGGVTLLSRSDQEYHEILSKISSFVQLFS